MKVGAACLPYVQELDRLVRIVDLEAEGDSATSAAARASAWGAWASEWETRTAARLEKLGRFETHARTHLDHRRCCATSRRSALPRNSPSPHPRSDPKQHVSWSLSRPKGDNAPRPCFRSFSVRSADRDLRASRGAWRAAR